MKGGRWVVFKRTLPPVFGKEMYGGFDEPAYPTRMPAFLFFQRAASLPAWIRLDGKEEVISV
jgi:hypothetical protein